MSKILNISISHRGKNFPASLHIGLTVLYKIKKGFRLQKFKNSIYLSISSSCLVKLVNLKDLFRPRRIPSILFYACLYSVCCRTRQLLRAFTLIYVILLTDKLFYLDDESFDCKCLDVI